LEDKLKYKLIVSDLDGTLLDSSRNISLRTRKLIQEFISRGGIFTFATGRMESSIVKYFDYLGLTGPAIIYNGSKIVDVKKEEILFENSLDCNLAKAVLKISKEYPWDALLYMNKKIYVREVTSIIEEYMIKDGVECEAVPELHEFITLPPTKILIIGNPDYFQAYVEKVSKHMCCSINYVNSEHNYLEILPENTSKGNALKELARLLNIPMEQVVAIGDNLNDISMIEAAGVGAATANAHEEVKKAADFITKSNDEDGVAEVIYRVINLISFN
jgi:Cof subfamily protein (haloacid dehalogenase superfamily)